MRILVIDDVDTLTTKGLDAGFDFLYRTLSRCKSGSKVLYTLRNAPSQSLLNSIEMPGLAVNGEYEAFVTACSQQFGTEEPTATFCDSVLAKESERRPATDKKLSAAAKASLPRPTVDWDTSQADDFRERGGSWTRT
jgi:hypothetical protein